MSKVDALRALREAKYDAARSSSGPKPAAGTPGTPHTPGTPRTPGPPRATLAAVPVPTGQEPAAEQELCGHRNMSGRSCTRPAQHPEKNHRYG